MKERKWNLKIRLLVGFFVLITVVSLIITALFLRTSMTMREDYKEIVRGSVEDIINSLDSMVKEIYYVSDTFAALSNNQLNYYLERKYGPEEELTKKADTIHLYNRILSSYDILQEKKKPGAIYTSNGVLFNFMDTDRDGQEVIDCLEKMNINESSKLMKFYLYPLQENFMVSEPYNEIRRDRIIIGTRRVFSIRKSAYICTHIFCVEEKELYEQYRNSVVDTKGDIYILDEKGELLSSSDVASVTAGAVDPDLKELVMNRMENEFTWRNSRHENLVFVRQSELSRFLTVAVIPREQITGEIDRLYRIIFLVLLVCMLVCCAMFMYLYRSFINPINDLNTAMKQVHDGNLSAYAAENGRNEIGDMMCYYNSMLRSINTHVVEKLQADRKKKELELEVLMGQINPHFLYNTLETIVWKSSEAGHPDIGRLSASLGRMYRLSISGGQVIVPMQQEIEHLMAYVNIQKYRYGERFTVDLQSDPVCVRRLYCLKILLQPVVENSFRYGMEKLGYQLVIRMKMRVCKDYVEILILDNGKGMDREQLHKVRQQIKNGRNTLENRENIYKSTGIGLHNVAARISLYCGMKEPVQIFSWEGFGTITRIRLPRLTEADIGEAGNHCSKNVKIANEDKM